MALTEQQRQDGTRELVRRMFVELNATANFSHDQLKAAFDAADDWADANATSYNNSLPVPFRTTASQSQKGFLLAILCLKRAGLI
jgi:hypothetical protein